MLKYCNMDLLLLNNIPIKPLCGIILEYYHYPRPYEKEMCDMIDIFGQIVEDPIWADYGYSSFFIRKRGKCLVLRDIHPGGDESFGGFSLLKRENERRISVGLKPNIFLYDIYPHTATNQSYLCF